MKQFKSVDEYIASYPVDIQKKLKHIRRIIKKVAPKSEEKMSYGMPGYKLHGPLFYFAAYKTHIGLYPTPTAIKAFKKELAKFSTSKGTVQLPLDASVPKDLIEKMLTFKLKENNAKKK